MSLTPPLVDEQVLKQVAADTGPELIPELVSIYLQDGHRRINNIAAAIRGQDIARLEHEVHTLGSSAAAYSNTRLHQVAREIEALCRENWPDQAFEQAFRLLELAADSFSALHCWIADPGNLRALVAQTGVQGGLAR
jgi:HPt (histidine-containing phosphotransfer) domain-containing protein